MPNRRNVLIGAGVTLASLVGLSAGLSAWLNHRRTNAGGVPLGMRITQEEVVRGRKLLETAVSADIHGHPGRSFISNAENLATGVGEFTSLGLFEQATISDMRTGGLTMASFATVSDFQLLDFTEKGLGAVREFESGEAWRSYERQISRIHEVLEFDRMMPILTLDDVTTAKVNEKLGVFITAEGGDFLEGSLAHLDDAFDDGMRSITLVHYHINEIGDIQTAPPRHGGLTRFGRELIGAMNSKGMLIDLAHASKETALEAVEISEKPVMVSHTNIRTERIDHPRFIDLDLAVRVAENGGVIGAWPAGIGLTTFSDYVDQILHTIDLIGIEHVALGTDMDANYLPVFESYRQLPMLVGALLKRGLSEQETTLFLGGNFLRVLGDVTRL